MKKVGIIIPYFGKLPNYFGMFLESCRYNPDFDWIIFTNDITGYDYPDNVHRKEMTFEECRQRIQSKFEFPISLAAPQKLCDYKPAYGYIFEEFLIGYDWWGYCDLDQIFGCLRSFITDEMLEQYDKLFSLGHLTLYRNSAENNHVFMNELNGKKLFEHALTSEFGCGFDEWIPGNINEIYLASGRPVKLDNIGADINPYKTPFTVVDYDINKRCYQNGEVKNSIFRWENGHLYQEYIQSGELCRREFAYAHLQKRKMKDRRSSLKGSYYMIPNSFVNGSESPEKLLNGSAKWLVLNYQFVKVKWNSLKYRVRKGDWHFQNVFR